MCFFIYKKFESKVFNGLEYFNAVVWIEIFQDANFEDVVNVTVRRTMKHECEMRNLYFKKYIIKVIT